MLFVYEIFIVQTWLKGWEKNIQVIIFVFERMNPLPTYLSMEGKDQNAVVRLKDFQNMSGFILNKSPKVFRYPREKTQPYTNNKSTMWEKLQLASEGLTL